MTGTIDALGLIYTNVEAKDSPTGQRGFQVWQASAGLSAEARKEVSRRVDDYRLPTGVPPEAAGEYGRDSYFKLSDKAGGGFAVARSGPLAGKDKFGRGGRFLAHVLVVSATDFAELHHDPFALFDAATFFTGEPETLAKDHPEWQKGVLPAVALTPAATAGDLPEGEVRSKFAGHVDRDAAQRKTVVLVAMPAAVAAVLRTVYRGLPPALRASAEFDTMSAGSSLTQVPCAFAGCPSAAVLKMWAFRRFVTFTPPGAFTPLSELQKPERAVCAALPGTLAWAEAADCARAAAWAVAAAVEAGRPADAAAALEAEAGPAALAILEATPAFAATVEKARRDWLAGCPAFVADVPGVRVCLDEHLAVPLDQQMRRLREGLPRPRIADLLLHAVTANCYGNDDPEFLGHVQDWLGKGHGAGSAGRRLHWALSRLRYRDADELGLVLSTCEGEDAVWFRDWLRDHAKANGITATSLRRELPHDSAVAAIDPRHVYDAELYLLCEPVEPPDAMRDLRFRHAHHTGGMAGLIARRDLPELADLLAYFRPRTAFGWTVLSDGTFFGGAFVYPRSGQDAELLAHVAEVGGGGRELLHLMYPQEPWPYQSAPKWLLGAEPHTQELLDKLKPPKGKSFDAAAYYAFEKELISLGELLFRETVAYLRDKLRGEAIVEVGSAGPPGDATLFGVRWHWKAAKAAPPQLTNLLQVVFGTAAPEIRRHEFPDPGLCELDPAGFAKLLSWLWTN